MSDMNKSEISRKEKRHTVRFPTLKDLQAAIRIYGNGDGSSTARAIVKDMGDLLSERGYRGEWDQHTSSRFQDCVITARRTQDKQFVLTINKGADIGNESELGLAKATNAQIGFSSCVITQTYAGTGDRFAIPLKDIETIHGVMGKKFAAAAMIDTLTRMKNVMDFMEGRANCLLSANEIGLTADLRFVQNRIVWPQEYKDNPARDYSYRIEGHHLTGPARLDKQGPRAIGLEFCVRAAENPTFNTEVAQSALRLADTVENLWKMTAKQGIASRPTERQLLQATV